MLFVHIVAGNDIFVVLPQEASFGGLQLQGDIIGSIVFPKTDGGKHFSADRVANPVPLRRKLCNSLLLHQIIINPGIIHSQRSSPCLALVKPDTAVSFFFRVSKFLQSGTWKFAACPAVLQILSFTAVFYRTAPPKRIGNGGAAAA